MPMKALLFLSTTVAGSVLSGPRQALLYGTPHPLRLKQSIQDLAATTNGGGDCSAKQAAEMEVLVSMLEKRNPTENSASSSLLAGEWDQVYTSNAMGITYGDGCVMRRELISGRLSGRVTQLIDQKRMRYRQPGQCRVSSRAQWAPLRRNAACK